MPGHPPARDGPEAISRTHWNKWGLECRLSVAAATELVAMFRGDRRVLVRQIRR